MNNNQNKRPLLLVLLLFSSLYLTACSDVSANQPNQQITEDTNISAEATAEEISEETAESVSNKTYDISSEKVKVYYKGKFGEEDEEIDMYFLDGNKQIAFYDMDTVCNLMTKLYRDGYGDFDKDPDYTLSYATDENGVIFTRENGYTMSLDFDKDTISFLDYDKFICHSYDATTVDIITLAATDEDGQPVYLEKKSDTSFSRYGKEILFDLAKYNIDLVEQDGLYLLQAQTMSDILLTLTYTEYLYNGDAAIYANYENLNNDLKKGDGLATIYYKKDTEPRSRELIEYTYNELCMVLDHEYGLKDIHQIEDFDTYFQEIEKDGVSLKQMLMNEDPVKSEEALYILTSNGFDDLHSRYNAPSVFAGTDSTKEVYQSCKPGPSTDHMIEMYDKHLGCREQILGDEEGNIPNYQEVGNTAYITFDHFSPVTEDYYNNPPKMATDDTVGLLIYANSQIKRENSPIENVVIDLSCNTGGDANAVAFVCSWFLGNANVYIENSLTKASSVNVYSCDANLDHKFDSSDSVSDLNLYCLISPVSFSCGNLAPTMFSCSSKVTLIGQTTGGGSCVVLPITTASGSMIQVSGFKVVSTMKNGSFYNADQGVKPDYPISKTEHFYDREYLTDYINNLP